MLTFQEMESVLQEKARKITDAYTDDVFLQKDSERFNMGFNTTPTDRAFIELKMDGENVTIEFTFRFAHKSGIRKKNTEYVTINLRQYDRDEFEDFIERRLDYFDNEIIKVSAEM